MTLMAQERAVYSLRLGLNKNLKGFPLDRIRIMFRDVVLELESEGYFQEYLGYWCIDDGDVPGKIRSPETDVVLKTRKDHLWPIRSRAESYSEDDLFDMIEYLFSIVSKPLEGRHHSFAGCGMHWHTFNQDEGRKHYRERVIVLLDLYERRFELSPDGEVLAKAEKGFEPIFLAEIPSGDDKIKLRVQAAVIKFRRHGSTFDDRRQAVRDLVDVLEYVRPQVKQHLLKKDEAELFNIANNFGVRHHNANQKTDYDAALWQSWMFYVFLSTIHLVLRKIDAEGFVS